MRLERALSVAVNVNDRGPCERDTGLSGLSRRNHVLPFWRCDVICNADRRRATNQATAVG